MLTGFSPGQGSGIERGFCREPFYQGPKGGAFGQNATSPGVAPTGDLCAVELES